MFCRHVLLNWYFSMNKKIEKDSDNFWYRKLTLKFKRLGDFALFDTFPLIQFSKFNNFLWVCWFLGKNRSNFVPPVWNLHISYCHSVDCTWHAWLDPGKAIVLPTQEIGKNINKTRKTFFACRLRSGCLDNGYACQKTIVVFLFSSLYSISALFPYASPLQWKSSKQYWGQFFRWLLEEGIKGNKNCCWDLIFSHIGCAINDNLITDNCMTTAWRLQDDCK